MLGICTYERSCLFIVTIMDLRTYAAPELKRPTIENCTRLHEGSNRPHSVLQGVAVNVV